MTTLGPIDFIVVRFPGTEFSPEVASGITSLVEAGTIRVIDLLFLSRADGDVINVFELADVDDEAYAGWEAVVDEVQGYLTEEDARALGETLPPQSSAVLALIENTWALGMVKTIADARGEVLISERVPRPVVEELVALH